MPVLEGSEAKLDHPEDDCFRVDDKRGQGELNAPQTEEILRLSGTDGKTSRVTLAPEGMALVASQGVLPLETIEVGASAWVPPQAMSKAFPDPEPIKMNDGNKTDGDSNDDKNFAGDEGVAQVATLPFPVEKFKGEGKHDDNDGGKTDGAK